MKVPAYRKGGLPNTNHKMKNTKFQLKQLQEYSKGQISGLDLAKQFESFF